MSSDFVPAPREPQPGTQRIRFTLRELCILIALVSLSAAAFSWIRTAGPVAALPAFVGASASIGFVIYLLTRWSFGSVFAVTSLLCLMLLCLVPPYRGLPNAGARRASCSNNLHNIVLALQQYELANGCFPPAYIADDQGKPMHSWRVLLLPYLEQKNLYDQYRFDEPWDGPHNSKLHSVRLRIYQCPSDNGAMTDTSYVAIVGPQTIWPGTSTVKMADIIDGTSNTIILAEVANSGVHWMEPTDLDASQMSLLINAAKGPGISSGHKNGANVAYADGSIRFLANKISPAALRAALTRNGKEVLVPP